MQSPVGLFPGRHSHVIYTASSSSRYPPKSPPQRMAGQRAYALDLRRDGGRIHKPLQHVRPPAARRRRRSRGNFDSGPFEASQMGGGRQGGSSRRGLGLGPGTVSLGGPFWPLAEAPVADWRAGYWGAAAMGSTLAAGRAQCKPRRSLRLLRALRQEETIAGPGARRDNGPARFDAGHQAALAARAHHEHPSARRRRPRSPT